MRPHVLKYLHFHLGECYFLSESDPYGLFLFHLLRRPLTDARRDHVLEEYEATWHVGLGSYGGRGLKEATGKSVYQLNAFVHAIILNEMHGWVELAVDHGQQAKFAIEGFMGKYGFDEQDIQFDALKKSWQRYLSHRKASKRKTVSLTGRMHLRELEKSLRNVPMAAKKAA